MLTDLLWRSPTSVTQRWNNIYESSNKSDFNILYEIPNLPAKNWTENTASCMEWQNDDECRSKSENPTRSASWQWLTVSSKNGERGWAACVKNGPVEMRTGCINVGRKNGRKENWVAADPIGSHVQEVSMRAMVKSSQKPERVEWKNTTFLKLMELRRHKQRAAISVYLLMQVPTCYIEASLRWLTWWQNAGGLAGSKRRILLSWEYLGLFIYLFRFVLNLEHG
jgi:hypothetical protein